MAHETLRELHINSFMLIPTMACQASCRYCFAAKSGAVMSRQTAEAAVAFISERAFPKEDINLTFHGGEPLLAGADFYEWILPLLQEKFGRRIHINIQSNLWAADERIAELFARFMVTVGTSLDGPKDMCDDQRGEGYYERTVAGIRLMRKHGVPVNLITTFMRQNVDRAAEVYSKSVLPYAVHGAVPSAEGTVCCTDAPGHDRTGLTADEYSKVILDTYEAYREDISHNKVATIDSMAKAVLDGRSGLCIFDGCLGKFAVIDPAGDIYSCQRFIGLKEYRLGNVAEDLTEQDIIQNKGWQKLESLQKEMQKDCGGCAHSDHCKGGCLYNAVAGKGSKDPYCGSYKTIFDRISIDIAKEMGSVLLGEDEVPRVLAMAGGAKHPADLKTTRRLLEFAIEAGRKEGKSGELKMPRYPENELNKFYLHITGRCGLRCSHCYSRGGETAYGEMTPQRLAKIVQEAADHRFHTVVITGGEPLSYPYFDELCSLLEDTDLKGTRLVLRSSFGQPVEGGRLARINGLFDKVIVSLDGDRETHDARRGAGQYDITAANLKNACNEGMADKLGICAVLRRKDADGVPGMSVRQLAQDLGISDVRIRPMLPIGRAEGDLTHEMWQTCSEDELMNDTFCIRENCGLGHNLYVMPDGRVYPCYAWCEPGSQIGDLKNSPLSAVLTEDGLYRYQRNDVDSNKKCRDCEVRYLCGGICKAWVKDRNDPDSGDFDCSDRKAFFRRLAQDVLPERS